MSFLTKSKQTSSGVSKDKIGRAITRKQVIEAEASDLRHALELVD